MNQSISNRIKFFSINSIALEWMKINIKIETEIETLT